MPTWDETADNLIALLEAFSNMIGKFANADTVGNTASALSTKAQGLAVLGTVFGYVENPIQQTKRVKIIDGLAKLYNSLQHSDSDLCNRGDEIGWSSHQLAFTDAVRQIKHGMNTLYRITRADINQEKQDEKDRLEELCANQSIHIAVNALFDGLTGKGEFGVKNLLQSIYDKTNGDRPAISKFAGRLFELLLCGMVCVTVYESIRRGQSGANTMTTRYYDQLNSVKKCIDDVFKNCEVNIEKHMQIVLDKILKEHHKLSKEDLAKKIFTGIHEKFDWIWIFAIVHASSSDYGIHGYYVCSESHDKAAVVFYHELKYGYKNAAKKHLVQRIVDRVPKKQTAPKVRDYIRDELDKESITKFGVACIERKEVMNWYYNLDKQYIHEVTDEFAIFVLIM